MEEIKVSVVIPAYNVASFIEEALLSVLEQDHAVSEIVVVDDASSDETVQVVQSFAANQDKVPIRLLINEQNQGVSFTRNRGIASTTSEFVAFLDPDDKWRPNHIRLSVAALEDADFSYGWLKEFGDESRIGLHVICPSQWERITWPTSFFRRHFIYPSALCARRSALQELGGFADHARIGEDWILMARAILSGMNVVEVPYVTCAMRKHPESATAKPHDAVQRCWDDCQPVLEQYPVLRRYRAADYYRHLGYWAAHTNPIKAVGWYVRAIGEDPIRLGLWLRLALLFPMCLKLEFLIPPALRFLKPPKS